MGGTAGEAPRGNDASTASLKSRTENSLLEQARSVFSSLRHRNVRTAIASCEEACTKGYAHPYFRHCACTCKPGEAWNPMHSCSVARRAMLLRCTFLPLPTSRQIFCRET